VRKIAPIKKKPKANTTPDAARTEGDYKRLTIPQLRELIEKRGLNMLGCKTKAQFVDVLVGMKRHTIAELREILQTRRLDWDMQIWWKKDQYLERLEGTAGKKAREKEFKRRQRLPQNIQDTMGGGAPGVYPPGYAPSSSSSDDEVVPSAEASEPGPSSRGRGSSGRGRGSRGRGRGSRGRGTYATSSSSSDDKVVHSADASEPGPRGRGRGSSDRGRGSSGGWGGMASRIFGSSGQKAKPSQKGSSSEEEGSSSEEREKQRRKQTSLSSGPRPKRLSPRGRGRRSSGQRDMPRG